MNYGISLAIGWGVTLEEALEKIAAAGFREVELPCAKLADGAYWDDPARWRRAIRGAGMTVRVAHSPDTGWNNGTSDEATRLASIEVAASSFAAAAEVGAGIIICHPNSSSQTFTPEDYDACRARSVRSFEALSRRAAKAGLKMAVENMPARGLPRPGVRVAELLDMIATLGEGVGICLDAGHSNASGLNAADEARVAGTKVLAVHLQDNDGKGEDQHLIPGEGTTDWDALIAALDAGSPRCVRTFEVGPERFGIVETLRCLVPLRERWEKR